MEREISRGRRPVGREHRLPRNPRLREESDRRAARVSPDLSAALHRLSVGHDTTIAGIDVGEDFLDLAILVSGKSELRLARTALRGISGDTPGAVARLAARIIDIAPELAAPAIALVDSPRWPCDLDWSKPTPVARAMNVRGRLLDAHLRALMGHVGGNGPTGAALRRLSMFPTPRFEYFARCAASPACKPHLRALACELFADTFDGHGRGEAPRGGAIFTRFMLSGFAAYRALERIGAAAYECYPDLQFRLWAHGTELPPKGDHRNALTVRTRINARIARNLGLRGAEQIATMDQADAAILALSTAAALRFGMVAVIEEPAEGHFAVALGASHARRLVP